MVHTAKAKRINKLSRIREVKLIPISNSRGVRLPKTLLDKYDWSDRLTLEGMEDSIVLLGNKTHNLSWEETARAMAEESEDWSDLNIDIADGAD